MIGNVARVIGALALVGVAAGLLMEEEPQPGRAGVVAGLLVVAVVLVVLRAEDMRKLFGRLESLKAPGVEAVFAKEPAQQGAKQAQPEEADPEETVAGESDPEAPAPITSPGTMVELRLKLEMKMAYIAKYLLAERDPETTEGGGQPLRPTFLTIGSLRHDRYLTENEAIVATQVMTLRDADLRRVPDDEREAFMRNANQVVGGIRASVFRAMVRKRLRSAKLTVEDDTLTASLGGRPDLEVTMPDGATYRIVPVFATSRSSDIHATARRRLAKAQEPAIENRILVVPDRPRSPTDDADPRTVKLADLLEALDA